MADSSFEPPPSTLTTGLIDFWHEHLVAIVVVYVALLAIARFYFSSNGSREKKPEVIPNSSQPKQARPSPSRLESQRVEAEHVGEKPGEKGPEPRRIKGVLRKRSPAAAESEDLVTRRMRVLIFYSSITTNTQRIAGELASQLQDSFAGVDEASGCTFESPELLDLSEIDFDDYFVTPPKAQGSAELFYLLLLPSYNIDTINDTFLEQLSETHHDFRIDTAPLSSLLGYAVFGFGDREGWPSEREGFCFQATEVDKWMAKLTGRKRAYPVGMGDVKTDATERLEEWHQGVKDVLHLLARTGGLGEGAPGSGNAIESGDEADDDDDDGEVLFEDEQDPQPKKQKPKPSRSAVVDVEDLGGMMKDSATEPAPPKAPLAIDFTTYSKPNLRRTRPSDAPAPKEMVAKNSPTYAALTKQGYTIVGSHSGVKICRWTKSALRGRGSCYKFSFYGINSHQCMETTPSLSCSNKCVFCWRHGTNPVGTTWRWVVDPPEQIFDGVKAGHYAKIRMLRGMAGVRAERYAEALRIRHCALSLVGEPIFYPHINEFLAMLHGERISSFLVCNAQHPDQLANLKAVTQLYVSIDASNKESLRRIDRPLHRDFWERFERCLDVLREKRFRHRTVFRLTLVKGFNVEDEVRGYADLVERGLPCFVEVKGVTYCGTATSANAGLTMANVPFYWEVCDFVTQLEAELQRRGLGYGLAAEHAHSCCVLLASERFKVAGKWHTLIDYDKFFALLEERGVDGEWTPEEYMGPPTPEWATWGNGGFDPRDVRVDRKGRPIAAS